MWEVTLPCSICNFPMIFMSIICVCWLVCWMIGCSDSRSNGRSVCHYFLKRQNVTIPCFYWRTSHECVKDLFQTPAPYLPLLKWKREHTYHTAMENEISKNVEEGIRQNDWSKLSSKCLTPPYQWNPWGPNHITGTLWSMDKAMLMLASLLEKKNQSSCVLLEILTGQTNCPTNKLCSNRTTSIRVC